MTSGKRISPGLFSCVLAACCSPLLIFPLLQYLAVAKHGSDMFLGFGVLLVLPSLAAFLIAIVAPFLLFSRRLRPLAACAFAGSVVLIVATIAGLRIGHKVRMIAFRGLAERSKPLVQAIQSFESLHGSPPTELNALVPEFLPEIPSTGIAAYPRYEYHTAEKAAKYEGNPWILTVFTPSGGINFDQFMYFPKQNYPEKGYGGWLEGVADWAYVHE